MATMLSLKLEGDGLWPDLAKKVTEGKVIHMGDGSKLHISCLSRGTSSGRPSAMFRFDLPNGITVVQEVTVANLLMALRAIEARYGLEVDDPGRNAPAEN